MKRYNSLYLFLTAFLLGGYIWLFYKLTEEGGKSSIQLCLFHKVTGFACPSCGTTRSILYLLGGDILASILTNPFGLIVFLGMMTFPVLILYDLVTKDHLLIKLYFKAERYIKKPRVAIPLVSLVIVNWFWNIYKDL